MSKSILRLIITFFVITVILSVVPFGCSCGKNPGGNGADNNPNNTGGNGSGSGNGGDGVPKGPAITFENFDTDVAEMVGSTIELKASGFPKTYIDNFIPLASIVDIKTKAVRRAIKRAFDVTITSDGTRATGGLVFVGPGDLLDASKGFTNFSVDGVNKDIATYSDNERKEGIRSDRARSTATGSGLIDNGFNQAGWNILSPFMSTVTPTQATAGPDIAPFSFTETSHSSTSIKPVLFCRTTISTITSGSDAGDGTAQDDTKLTGGQTASCYVGAYGYSFSGKAADDWLKKPAGNDFKKKFNIAVAGIRTDDNPISKIGLTGNSAEFRNGINTTEMKLIADKNPSAFREVSVEMVKGDFVFVKPEITIDNFAAGVRMNGDTIEIKPSAFPKDAASNNIAVSSFYELSTNADTDTASRVFDITMTSDTVKVLTGGLVMVAPGSVLRIQDFYDISTVPSPPTIPPTYVNGSENVLNTNEGFGSDKVSTQDKGYLKKGWNYFGVFMSDKVPSPPPAGMSAADVSPFAFTKTANSQPFFFCRSTLPTFVDGILISSSFVSGQKASCYVGANGVAFDGSEVTDWFNDTDPNFKRKFNIAIGVFRTDVDTVDDFWIGNTVADKIRSMKFGINSDRILNFTSRYPHNYKKVGVTIVPESTVW